MPMEDYTKDHNYDSCEGNYIYDRYWDAFIQERYNAQNKKLTAYFTLTPADYIQLKFNRFVTLQNQLFVVNKVFDFDINNNAPTKVELIQITDIEGYASMNGLFEGFYATPSRINIVEAPASGDVYVYVHSEDPVYGNLVTTTAASSGTVSFLNQGTDTSTGITTYKISYNSLGATSVYEGYIHLTSGGETIDVPVHIERGTYYYLTFNVSPDTLSENEITWFFEEVD